MSQLFGVSAEVSASADAGSHNAEQFGMICRYIAWRNRHTATHPRLRKVVAKAETIMRAKVA